MHNAEKPNPPASVRATWGQGGLSASSNTRARNSLRAVALQSAPSGGVHGEGVRKCLLFNALRLRFRLVASDFPGIVCILDRDRPSAVVLKAIGGRSRLFQGQLPSQRLPAASSAETGELAVRQSAGWRFGIGVRRPTRVSRAKDRSKLPRQPA